MDDENNFLAMDDKTRLSADITYLMLKGAGYAAFAVLGVWLVFAVISAVGSALPEDSKMADDPTPWSFLLREDLSDGTSV